MSHQTADSKLSTELLLSEQQSDVKNQNKLSADVGSPALKTEVLPPIFKVYNDCWLEIFDWLSLEDIHSFGQTCKKFYRLAGEYFYCLYQRVDADVNKNSMTVNWKDLNGFNEFAPRLSFYDCEPDESFQYALANCKSAREIEIVNARSSQLHIESFEKFLSRIEVFRISNIYLSDEFFESFLKLCGRLKRLMITKCPGTGWMNNEYPNLEHLQLLECDPLQDIQLMIFFEQNPNIRSFSTTAATLLRNRDNLMANDIEVNDLTISRCDDIDLITFALIDLHKRGFYQRLHIICSSEERLTELPGLTTLHIDTYNYIQMPTLPTVKELVFKALWNGLRSWMKMDEVSIALKNLERISMFETSTEYMMPFIRNAMKLKEIKMDYLRGDIDVLDMNNQREQLECASKMTIYLGEKDFLKLKWKYGKSDFGLIEIKRQETYDGLWIPTFD